MHKKTTKQSSRSQFIAEHRGGPITKDTHRKLMNWAIGCSKHVLTLINDSVDQRLIYALDVAELWGHGNVPTGDAMKASLGAHAAAKAYSNPVAIAVARSIGQAVATAHMADHSVGAALYALKATKLAGKSVEEEKKWQDTQLQQLPQEIIELMRITMKKKADSLFKNFIKTS